MTQPTFHFVLKTPPLLVEVDKEVATLLGYRRDDLLAGTVALRDRIHPEDAALADALFDAEALFSAESEEAAGALNLRMRHADGVMRCLRAQYRKTRAPDGPPQLDLFLEDARMVAEPGDAQLVAIFKTLIERTTDFISLKNRNHVILAAGRSLRDFVQETAQAGDPVGKTDYDIVPEPLADLIYRLENRAMREGRRVSETQPITLQNGSLRWVDNRKYPIDGPDGRIAGFLGIAEDVTAHLEQEQRLRASEESLRLSQRIAGLGSYTLHVATGQWTCSEVMNEIFGIGPAYTHTVDEWLAVVHPEDRAAMSAYLADEVLGQGKLFDRVYRIVRACDGASRWVYGRGELSFDAEGRPVTMHGTIQDITERKRTESALHESKELLQLFIEHAPAALAMLDRQMRYLAVSRRWREMHALGDLELVGRSHYEVSAHIPESWREEHRRCLDGEIVPATEGELTLRDGSLRWVWRELLPWRSGDGSIGGMVIFTEDITERKRDEERLQLAATVFTGAREGIVITDPLGTILEVNEAFTRITGFMREELLGKNPRILQSGMQNREFYKKMWEALQRDGCWSGELWNRSKSGNIFAQMLNIHAIHDAGGAVKQFVGLSTDITEAKRQEQRLELAAHYDALTGLPNRTLLAGRLRQAMAQARRREQLLGVASFDLDGFKAINDTFGQTCGDALLTTVALRMKRVLHEGDTLARLGGDEFAAILLDLPHRDACMDTLTRMIAAAAEEVDTGGVKLSVTASAGLAFYPQEEDVDADMLLRQAGQALYEAKLAGKNRYSLFDPRQDLVTRSRLENIERLRRALAANEFVLHYQPKVNMRTGRIIGAEALLRWQHPDRGLLPPGMFLPTIEDHPLAVEVGQWVIETALQQMEAWKREGFALPVSVNVSAFELQQPEFAAHLCARLQAHPQLKPSDLELEVLETSALRNVLFSAQALATCREAGVQISVDDFGTGYSSLAYLKRLPAHVLKIDQSFVRDMLDEQESLPILRGILGLAEAFRMHVIAEGVETVEHGLMLLHLGCDCAQGYGIASPMPAEELRAWAMSWRADPRWSEAPTVQTANRAALFAVVEHRAWYGHFLGHIHGTRSKPPVLDAAQCGMGAWIETQKLAAGGVSPSLQAIQTLHEQFHALAKEIDEAHRDGRKQDVLGMLRQLRYLHERCLKRLQPFTRASAHSAAGSVILREVLVAQNSSAA